jgi:hypothetical protein
VPASHEEWQMTIFDKYSVLDPAKMLREIDAEIDGDTFDKYSVLDLEHARRQMSAAGIEVSNAAMMDPARLGTDVDTALADIGGGAPEWVPDGALTVVDLKNGQYYFDGAERTRAETIEGNADWGTFDATKIVDGVGGRATAASGSASFKFVLTSAAANGLLPSDGGFTCVATYSNSITGAQAQASTLLDILDFPNYSVEWTATFQYSLPADEDANTLNGFSDSATPDSTQAASHNAAFTFSLTTIAGSVDGGTVEAVETIVDNTGATNIAVNVSVFLTNADSATAILEKLIFYAPVSNTELPALSNPSD